MKDSPGKRAIAITYSLGVMLVWLFRGRLFALDEYGVLYPFMQAVTDISISMYAILGFFLLLLLLGMPDGSTATREGLLKAGFTNHAGETPFLISKRQDSVNPDLTVWEFDPCGIPLGEWEEKRAEIETALNITIAKIAWARDEKLSACTLPRLKMISRLCSIGMINACQRKISSWYLGKASSGL